MTDPGFEKQPFLMHRSVAGAPEESLVKMTEFARKFPCLDDAKGVDPWDPEALGDWACREGETSAAQLWTAGFLLGVWDHNGDEELFDLHAAVRDWDKTHLEAFIAWCREPWWPEVVETDV